MCMKRMVKKKNNLKHQTTRMRTSGWNGPAAKGVNFKAKSNIRERQKYIALDKKKVCLEKTGNNF